MDSRIKKSHIPYVMNRLHISYGWCGHLARAATGGTPVRPFGGFAHFTFNKGVSQSPLAIRVLPKDTPPHIV